MKNLKEREEVIEYSIKLNTTNLSPLRSGNISVRGIEEGVEGFFITPSGKKYESLKLEDIVLASILDQVLYIALSFGFHELTWYSTYIYDSVLTSSLPLRNDKSRNETKPIKLEMKGHITCLYRRRSERAFRVNFP